MAGLEAEVGPVDVLIQVFKLKYQLTGPEYAFASRRSAIQSEIVKLVREHRMVPWYRDVWVAELGMDPETIPSSELLEMQQENDKRLAEIESTISAAEEDIGDKDARVHWIAKIDHFADIGDKDSAIFWSNEALQQFEKSASLGVRLDILFKQVRVAFAFSDSALVRKGLSRASSMMANKGADWERRNRLKLYEGFDHLLTRDFATAAATFRDGVATFASSEMTAYSDFVAMTAIASLVSLSRADIKKKILGSADILALERAADADALRAALRLARALVDCLYDDFFPALHQVCLLVLESPWFGPHVQYYYRELRVKGFAQYLSAYEKVTLSQMAAAFGISVAVLDAQLASFIAAKRLDCTVDEVDSVVYMRRSVASFACFCVCLRVCPCACACACVSLYFHTSHSHLPLRYHQPDLLRFLPLLSCPAACGSAAASCPPTATILGQGPIMPPPTPGPTSAPSCWTRTCGRRTCSLPRSRSSRGSSRRNRAGLALVSLAHAHPCARDARHGRSATAVRYPRSRPDNDGRPFWLSFKQCPEDIGVLLPTIPNVFLGTRGVMFWIDELLHSHSWFVAHSPLT